MYELFCGQPMFRGRSFGEYVRKHLTEQPVRPQVDPRAARDIDERLEALIMRCLEKEPDARFMHIVELRDALLTMLGAMETQPPPFGSLTASGLRPPPISTLPSLPAIPPRAHPRPSIAGRARAPVVGALPPVLAVRSGRRAAATGARAVVGVVRRWRRRRRARRRRGGLVRGTHGTTAAARAACGRPATGGRPAVLTPPPVPPPTVRRRPCRRRADRAAVRFAAERRRVRRRQVRGAVQDAVRLQPRSRRRWEQGPADVHRQVRGLRGRRRRGRSRRRPARVLA